MSTQVFGWSKIKDEDNAAIREFASDVCSGLAKPQKELHSKYLYDELGSSLFEAITHLPEYGLTRADEGLLRRHAGDIAKLLPSPVAVIELAAELARRPGICCERSAVRLERACATIRSTSLPTHWRVASAICPTWPRCIPWSSPISM